MRLWRVLSVSIVLASASVLSWGQSPMMNGTGDRNECPRCHRTTPKEGKYCMHCGRKIPVSTGAVFPTKTFCLACGWFAFGVKGACEECSSGNVRVVNYVVVDPKVVLQVVKCQTCSGIVRKGARYCPACGATVTSKSTKTRNANSYADTCPKCRAGLSKTSIYCPGCGARRRN